MPAILWFLPFALFRLAGGTLAAKDYLLRFGITFIPIMAAAHAVKSLLKATSRIPYWEYVAADPLGIQTAQGILAKTTSLAPLPAWRDPAVTVLSLLLMGIAIALSLVVTRKLIAKYVAEPGRRSLALYLTPVLYGGMFAIMLVAWRVL